MTDGDNATMIDGTPIEDIIGDKALRDNGFLTEKELALTETDRSEKQTIELSVTVDVRDMDTESREAIARLAELYEDAFQEVVEKNRDYSFSFIQTGRKLAASDGTPCDDPARSTLFGLLTRTGDKRERFIENVFGNGDSSVSDTPATTATETANYWFFAALVTKYPDLAAEL